MWANELRERHLYHLVNNSPWPMLVSFGALFFTLFFALYTSSIEYSLLFLYWNLLYIIVIAYNWWNDVNSESTFLGHHTLVVKRGLWMGFILFMASEVMIFFVFFWGYFHYSLTTVYDIGFLWPGMGIGSVNAYSLPLLNTLILILSGITLTISHNSLLIGEMVNANIRLIFTILLGIVFECLQLIEYSLTAFNFNDMVYGNIFYFLTGLHGFHVFVGIIFLIVCLYSLQNGYMVSNSHTGYEFAIWYWHFVDVVWVILFFIVYWW